MMTIMQECPACNATGLYQGFGERDGTAVVCQECEGTGRQEYHYTPFVGRAAAPPGVARVFERNPGIVLGDGVPGGIPLAEWDPESPFPSGREDREHTCPLWWHWWHRQQPDWDECRECEAGTSYRQCPHFGEKAKCWERWDAEENTRNEEKS